jgi:hypothetical protein
VVWGSIEVQGGPLPRVGEVVDAPAHLDVSLGELGLALIVLQREDWLDVLHVGRRWG